ncbi:MAG: MBL fold metallo-hydrolase [Puia sp.]|nr:MBL fold metallo-hydrolase [Puia sp.]
MLKRILAILTLTAMSPCIGSGQPALTTNQLPNQPPHQLPNQLPNPELMDSCLNAKGNAYMNRQADALLKEVDSTLRLHPPSLANIAGSRERYLALLLLDAVLHDRVAAHRQPVQDFFHRRVETVVDELEHTKVGKGAMIWKLYNMGFVVRTRTVTLTFDLTDGKSAGSAGFVIPETLMKRLTGQCDVLFISHRHQDHAEEEIARQFIDDGKPVVAPPEIWRDRAIYPMITHLRRTADSIQVLPVGRGVQRLKVVLYPGHQMGNVENNVPLVFTPEGLSFCHMGDQINERDFMIDYAWIDSVSRRYKVDVLMPPCWTNELFRIVKGFNPRLVIPGHENELGHPVDDRVPFWGDNDFLGLTYSELKQSNYKVLPMTWGESVLIQTASGN